MISLNILSEVNSNLVKEAKKNDRDYSYFHASSWDVCQRKTAYQYYEALGFIKTDPVSIKTDARIEKVFGAGHYMHDRWRKYLESTGALLGVWKCSNINHDKSYGLDEKFGVLKPEVCECGCTEFKYIELGFRDEETLLGGHVDAILDVRIIMPNMFNFELFYDYCDRLIIIDFKTIHDFGFKGLKEPKERHFAQMQMYFFLTGLKYGKLIYENKNDQNVKEYLVIRDDDFINKKTNEAKILKSRISKVNSQGKKVLPPRAFFSRDNMDCRTCQYKSHCWKTK